MTPDLLVWGAERAIGLEALTAGAATAGLDRA